MRLARLINRDDGRGDAHAAGSAQANILGELSRTKLLRGEIDSALRLASRGTRIDLALPSDVVKASAAAAALAAAVSQANWRFALGGHDDYVYSAAFSSDGSRIVTASEDKTARIWDAASAKEIAVLRGHVGTVLSAAFSPDGSRIFTASSDSTRIWDTASAKEIAVLRGHVGTVLSAAFSPDGSRIVTASWDNTARIWDAASAKEIAVLRGHDYYVQSAAFSSDGSRIVTASWDKTARIWDAHLQMMAVKDLLAQTCVLLAGVTKLTREEMRLAGYPDDVSEIDVCSSGQ
jgi:predicted oxidoreductase (fatty acid repression mutant protein)